MRNFKWAALVWLSVLIALVIAYPLVFSTPFQQRLGALVLLYAIAASAWNVVGGYAGKGIGEFIDPTTEDDWLRDNFESRPYVAKGDKYEDFHPAYRYGALAEAKYGDAGIDLMDKQLQSDWEASKENTMPWTKAKGAVKDAYDRTVQIRRERECAEMCDDVQED